MPIAIGAATVAVWVYLLFFRGGFWWLPYRPRTLAAHTDGRSVVAVIPARDEAEVVGRSVASLLAQDFSGSFRIVLVDDQSDDGTAEAALAAAAAAQAPERLTICRGKPVPSGWTGKLWAMRQGVEAALSMRPDYLLLTDADIVHGPSNLRELVSRCETEGCDLASLMVRLHCRSVWEKLLIPAFVFFFFKLYPPRWVADPSRRTAGAAGGCMLIRASTLDRIGGIDGIRGEIIDDCALARRVKSVGQVWLGPARQTISIREYRAVRPIWDMVVRSAFAQLDYSPVMLVLTVAMLVLTYLAPPLLLLAAQPAAVLCGAIAWLGMTVAFLPTLRAYKAPRAIAPLLPLIALFYVAATVGSAVLFWRGRGGYWKGRVQAPAPDRT
ncbi:MAG: glycosyltransferase [Alphaproteobacteria bacterium]|nr:glycosyltransferase [Alphaproteobacteria bacterium]